MTTTLIQTPLLALEPGPPIAHKAASSNPPLSTMHDFAKALLGGVCIGGAAAMYLCLNGRILGVSGMMGQVMNPDTITKTPAVFFFAGLLAAAYFLSPALVSSPLKLEASTLQLIVSGLLVGFGTRMGSGCTSGHGVCGLSRWSIRSLAAVCTFMGFGFLTVYVQRHVLN